MAETTVRESSALSGRVALIDALRGVAASVVFWHHITVLFPQLTASGSALAAAGVWLSRRNVEAVLLFFVLSGLSIRLSIKALDMRTKAGVNEYLYRRFRRILPLYLLSLALAGAIGASVAPADPRSLSPLTLLGNLVFLQTSASIPGVWFPPFAQNGPLWSLSYEMFYYLAFPLTLLLSGARLRLAAALAATLIGLVVLQIAPNPIAAFLASSLVWYLGVELAELGLYGKCSVPWWCFSALALGISGVLQLRASATLTSLLTGLVQFHVGYALIALAERGTRIPRALDRFVIAPLAWVGSFSFGLYLLHYPILRAAAQLAPGTLGLAAGVALALVVAYFAELHAIRAKLLFLRRSYL